MTSLVIEGVEIPEQLIRDEMPNHPAATSAEAHKNAARALAIKALLLNKASELGLSPNPEPDDAGRLETVEDALIRQVFAEELVPQAPSEAECRRFYDARPDSFFTPELYEASHILLLQSSGDIAKGLVKQLMADQSGFAGLAKSLSLCPSGQIGGSLGQLQRGDLVAEVEEALLSAPVGAIYPEPVASQFGWHILRLDRRVVRQRLPFEAVKAKIMLHLESRAWIAASAKYVEGLLDASKAKGVALRLGEAGDIERPSLSLGGLVDDEKMAARIEPWLAAVDPDLLSRVAAASEAQSKTVIDLVRGEVRHFLDHADDEAFTQLVSAAQGSDDPMLASVACILKASWRRLPGKASPSSKRTRVRLNVLTLCQETSERASVSLPASASLRRASFRRDCMDMPETEIEQLPDALIHEPLNWLFAEHYRHRQLCKLMEGLAKAVVYDDATMTEVIRFLRTDMPLHILDEEEDLFPLLRRRATPDDDLEHVLGVLSGEHTTDPDRVEAILSGLLKAQKDRKAPSHDGTFRTLMLKFVTEERRHVALENAIVLPIARLRLQPADLQALSARLAARRGRLLEGSR